MIETVVGIIIKGSSVLLGQRKETASYPLKWEFPGGKVEDKESLEACLRRELFEELSIEIKSAELYHEEFAKYANASEFYVYYYIAHPKSWEIKNLVFNKILWVPFNELLDYDILEGNKNVVQKLIQDYE